MEALGEKDIASISMITVHRGFQQDSMNTKLKKHVECCPGDFFIARP